MALRALGVCAALLVLLSLLGPAEGRSRTIDLGVVRYPAAAAEVRTAHHAWAPETRGDRYLLDYAHGLEAGRALEVDHRALGHRLRFRWIGDDAFEYSVPRGCGDDAWGCIYADVLARSEIDLAPLLARMEVAAREESWSRVAAARALLAFVQEIPYRIPDRHAFGVLPPALVASRYWGDCDSKSLLLLALLDRLGMNAVVLTSRAHQHAMVGIDLGGSRLPTAEAGYLHRGREYLWAETTAVGAPLGWRHPSMRTPDDWTLVPLVDRR